METATPQQYAQVIDFCKRIFEKKNHDYGTSWRILRLPSLTDQIFIKAQRIRSIQEKGIQMVSDDISSEFVGMINYCVIALIQLELQDEADLQLPFEEISRLYDEQVKRTFELLENKNHDYAEAWRQMRVNSMTDLILVKLLRIKQIEDNKGKTIASEGVAANYQDILNYSVFCLILEEKILTNKV